MLVSILNRSEAKIQGADLELEVLGQLCPATDGRTGPRTVVQIHDPNRLRLRESGDI